MAVNRFGSQQDNHSEKYASLLIPIRDLAKNWNVDVASLLEDYLSELGYVRISFEDHVDNMNFVEAAVLIQNSACVYSKKVDYLFNLVLQLLEHLKCKSANQVSAKKKVIIKNISSDDFPSFDDIEIDKNITLKESDGPVDLNAFTINRMPIELLNFIKDDDSGIPIYNLKGILVGDRNDFKVNCWQGSLYKTICDGVMRQKKSIGFDDQQENNLHGLSNEAVDPSPLNEDIFLNGDVGSDDSCLDPGPDPDLPGISDIDDAAEEHDMPPSVRSSSSESEPKHALAKAAEKALKEWDPLFAHETVKQRLRPVRKGRTIFESETQLRSSKRPVKRKAKTVADICNRELFSRQSKLPKDTDEEINCTESLANMFAEELRKKSKQKNVESNSSDAEDNEGDDFNGFDNEDSDNDGMNRPFSPCAAVNPEDVSMLDTTFDHIISQQTNEFLKHARDQADVSESDRRKRRWEEYLVDKLEDEEEYVSFNVREYTAKVLNLYQPNNAKQTITFDRITEEHMSKGEVSRLFFATLQLANNYNVDIQSTTESVALTDCEVTLLSRRQNYDQFDKE
ncbi:Lipase maturation factor 2 [Chamberlinius hualienensis]